MNEQLKSGDVTVAHSRRWTDFEDYLIPRDTWLAEREQHYAALGLPTDSDIYLTQLEGRLHAITAGVDARVPDNSALTIDRDKGVYHLARLKASSAHDAAKGLNDLLESRLPEVELIDALIDVDNDTDFLHHFLQSEQGRRLPPAMQRRNVLAALVAVGCNIGPTRMAAASGLSVWEISQAADWYLTADALKAAGIDLVNYAIHLPLSHLYGLGDTVGGLLGSLALGHLDGRIAPAVLLGGGAVLGGVIDLLIFYSPVYAPLVAPAILVPVLLMVLVGGPFAAIMTGYMTLAQTTVGDEYRGRLLGLFFAVQALSGVVGMALGGALGDSVGMIALLTLDSVSYVVGGSMVLILLVGAGSYKSVFRGPQANLE